MNKVLLSSVCLLALAGCSSGVNDQETSSRQLSYQCVLHQSGADKSANSQENFSVSYSDSKAVVQLGDKRYLLKRVYGGDGIRYVFQTQGQHVVADLHQSKQEVRLTIEDKHLTHCKRIKPMPLGQ